MELLQSHFSFSLDVVQAEQDLKNVGFLSFTRCRCNGAIHYRHGIITMVFCLSIVTYEQ